MANKLPTRILRFLTLFSIKEGYLTGRNFLGLILHPFRTITVLEREKDPVQILLVFGLPFYFWFGGVAAILFLRFFLYGKILSLGFLAKTSLIFISLLSAMFFSYLGYWIMVYLKLKKSQSTKR